MTTKRIAMFKIKSQGRVNSEWYQLSPRDDADKIGQALVIWFNVTGGNNDGSFRKFVEVAYDFTGTEDEFLDFIDDSGIDIHPSFNSVGTLHMLGPDYEELLDESYSKYRGE